jgi:hypothetical protein
MKIRNISSAIRGTHPWVSVTLLYQRIPAIASSKVRNTVMHYEIYTVTTMSKQYSEVCPFLTIQLSTK